MSGRHHVGKAQREYVKTKSAALADAVPENMVSGLRHVLAVSMAAGLSEAAAYASATEALRAFQSRLPPHRKAGFALEAGCIWLERERGRACSCP